VVVNRMFVCLSSDAIASRREHTRHDVTAHHLLKACLGNLRFSRHVIVVLVIL
jgi:hypothetical protein